MVELKEGKKHIVIKRDGREEPYSEEKLYKVIKWAVNEAGIQEPYDETFVKDVLKAIDLKIGNKISVIKLLDEVIETCANFISELYPIWDVIAKNLVILRYRKDVWNVSRNEYPDYLEVLQKGIQYKVYNKEILDTFTEEELRELGNYIKPERDFLFTFGGFELFMQKYSKKYTKTKFLELPQHRYMAVAIQLHYKDKNRLETIKRKYDDLSLHKFTAPTPMIVNALERVFNPTSCVLIEVDDDSESILEVARDMGIYSKYGSGIGLDVTRLRAIGAIVDLVGKTSGVINFIKLFESVISAFNQRGVRSGAAVVNFAWWHYESPEIIMLRDAGGADEERARKLKYTMKWNRRFSEAIKNGEEIFLFDPLDTPELIEAYGDEFDKWYDYYSKKPGIRKRKIKARELAFLYAKVRSETGNVYWLSMDNVNEQRVCPDVIKMSNLCVEIVNRTKPINLVKDKLVKDSDSDEWTNVRKYDGLIGICNLSSVNLVKWDEMTENEKDELAYSILLGMDNAFDVSNYKVRLGEKFNRDLRSIGIGVNNYANLLASKGMKFTDDEALKFTHELFEDLTYHFIKQAIRLAKERGKYKEISGTSWDKGLFPWELSKLPKEYHFEMKKDWEALRKELKEFGIRFENLFSIAPTQTSGLVINSTEGIEPIRQYKIIKEGTYTLPFLVPNLNKNRMYYELAWDIPTKRILELAAIRQKFLDQSQSVNAYYKNPDSAFEIVYDIIEAEKLGVKTLYYMNTLKAEAEYEICESCSS